MRIGNFDVASRVLIVAEVGNNHEGDPALAEAMIHAAAHAGADAVKFQTIVPEELVSADQTARLEQLRRFALSRETFVRLAETAAEAGVIFLSTAFDPDSLDFLDGLVPAHKIASGDNTFHPLLARAAATGKPILLSTGLADRETLLAARRTIASVWEAQGRAGELALLHCVTCYPTPPGDANLAAIAGLRALCPTVGYSDHTLGIEAAVLSVAAGARIIEKHFTLDKGRTTFRDHQLSADPDELAQGVRRGGEAETLMGDGLGRPACEDPAAVAVRRSVAAKADLAPGTVLAPGHLRWVRPGGGVAPGREDLLLGRRLVRAVAAGERILPADVEA